jgi:hypothetical protein
MKKGAEQLLRACLSPKLRGLFFNLRNATEQAVTACQARLTVILSGEPPFWRPPLQETLDARTAFSKVFLRRFHELRSLPGMKITGRHVLAEVRIFKRAQRGTSEVEESAFVFRAVAVETSRFFTTFAEARVAVQNDIFGTRACYRLAACCETPNSSWSVERHSPSVPSRVSGGIRRPPIAKIPLSPASGWPL